MIFRRLTLAFALSLIGVSAMAADGYAGFEELYRSGKIKEVACMAHIRRKFVDVFKSQGSHVAEQAITGPQMMRVVADVLKDHPEILHEIALRLATPEDIKLIEGTADPL